VLVFRAPSVGGGEPRGVLGHLAQDPAALVEAHGRRPPREIETEAGQRAPIPLGRTVGQAAPVEEVQPPGDLLVDETAIAGDEVAESLAIWPGVPPGDLSGGQTVAKLGRKRQPEPLDGEPRLATGVVEAPAHGGNGRCIDVAQARLVEVSALDQRQDDDRIRLQAMDDPTLGAA
jgi:hypothetical protein